MAIAWFKQHPSILGPRWLGLLNTEALPDREGFELSHPLIKVIEHVEFQELAPDAQLSLWRSALADFPLVILAMPETALAPELRKHIRFGIASRQFSNNWNWNFASKTLSCPAPFVESNLAEALLKVQKFQALRIKGKFPWSKATIKAGIALTIGLCLPFLSTLRVEIPKNTQHQLNKSNSKIQASEVEINAHNAFELKKQTRKALFLLGYMTPDDQWIQNFLDPRLKALGYEQGYQSGQDLSYKPMATLKFTRKSIPLNPLAPSEWEAYHFLSTLILDSLTYPTDYWWQGDEKIHRKHDGVDMAGPTGRRLLSPFSGKLIAWENDRAGKVAAVVKEPWIFYFAHCDQILFFDGDSVRAGDAIATIGMTGRTYGPHAHIGVGRLNHKYTGGHPSYTQLNPVEWYVNNREKLKLP